MMHKTQIFTLLLSCFFLTSCSVLSPVNTPEVNVYQLVRTQNAEKISDANTTSRPLIKHHKTLYVSPVLANAPYNSTTMFYRVDDYQLMHYTYSQWAARPDQMINQLVIQALSTKKYFSHVVTNAFIGSADYRLIGHLNGLTQVIQGKHSVIHLSIDYKLLNTKTGKLMASKTFKLQKDAPATAKQFALTTNSLTNAMVDALIIWLKEMPLPENS